MWYENDLCVQECGSITVDIGPDIIQYFHARLHNDCLLCKGTMRDAYVCYFLFMTRSMPKE